MGASDNGRLRQRQVRVARFRVNNGADHRGLSCGGRRAAKPSAAADPRHSSSNVGQPLGQRIAALRRIEASRAAAGVPTEAPPASEGSGTTADPRQSLSTCLLHAYRRAHLLCGRAAWCMCKLLAHLLAAVGARLVQVLRPCEPCPSKCGVCRFGTGRRAGTGRRCLHGAGARCSRGLSGRRRAERFRAGRCKRGLRWLRSGPGRRVQWLLCVRGGRAGPPGGGAAPQVRLKSLSELSACRGLSFRVPSALQGRR